MTSLVPFPANVRWSQFGPPQLRGQMRGREMSIVGTETIIPTLTGHWQLSGQFVLLGPEEQLEWQAFLAQMQGGIGQTDVPVYSRYRVPQADGRVPPFSVLPKVNPAEHFVFATQERENIELRESASERDTDLALTLVNSLRPRPGHIFSIGERLHRVQRAWDDDEGNPYVRVQPPLREPHSAGAGVKTDRPVCRMRLTDEGAGEYEETPRGIPAVSVSFVEAL